MDVIQYHPIGIIHTPFKAPEGTPIQPPGGVEHCAEVEVYPEYGEGLRDLEGFSHLILLYHCHLAGKARLTVKPFLDNAEHGLFSTRAPARPNPIGLSAVRLEGISHPKGGCRLHVAGVDLMDGTPVLDIKPYLPYADAVTDADGGFAMDPPSAGLAVAFSPQALSACRAKEADIPGLERFIVEMLQIDPRPAYFARDGRRRRFGMRIFDVDVQWECQGDRILVTALEG